MSFLTVKELAERWNCSIRTINMYLNSGRIPGAVRKGNGWMIPADAQKPSDRRRKQEEAMPAQPLPRTRKRFMSFMGMPFKSGEYDAFLESLQDDEERGIAEIGRAYMRAESERTVALAEKYVASDSPEIRISAMLCQAMAAVQSGDIDLAKRNFGKIKGEAENALDAAARGAAVFSLALITVFFHEEGAGVDELMPLMDQLDAGIRLFAMYGHAHALYLKKEYSKAIGVGEAAIAMGGGMYPVAGIYLCVVLSMSCNSLHQTEKAQQWYEKAWEMAEADGFIEPFIEHHGLLQGMVERNLRGVQPEMYQHIAEGVYRFSRGWMKIHNANSENQVSDALTVYEFSIAMLASKGRTNREIAEYLSISEHTVKHYMAIIFQKLGITKRSELNRYVNI